MLEIKQLVKKYHTGDLAINGVDQLKNIIPETLP